MAARAGSPGSSPPVPSPPAPVVVRLPITLGQFVKLAGIADTGGDAKQLIGAGHIAVNGEVETRRGRHLAPHDLVAAASGGLCVVTEDGSQPK